MHLGTNVRRMVAGAAAAAIAVAVPAFGAGASGASLSGCTSSTGVVVIVDFSHWGGTVERGCAPAPDNGLDALHDAGFTTAGTAQYGNAFVCRIDNHPSTAEQGCASTPPANAYWAYYHARWTDAGWTYNAIGATSTHPAPGSIEAWAFGARVLPSVSPAAAIATVTSTPPTTTPSQPPPTVTAPSATSSGSHAVGTTAPSPRGQDGAPSAARGSSRGTTTLPGDSVAAIAKTARVRARRAAAAAARRGGTGTTPTTSSTKSGAGVVDRADAPAPHLEDSGSPLPTILTVFALAAAGIIGVLVMRNRRRQLNP